MKEWGQRLIEELATWPEVRSKPMFGLVSFYSGDNIFAAIPRTRALGSPDSISLKFYSAAELKRAQRDPHLSFGDSLASGWVAFKLTSAQDIAAALRWLERAYRGANKHLRGRQ